MPPKGVGHPNDLAAGVGQHGGHLRVDQAQGQHHQGAQQKRNHRAAAGNGKPLLDFHHPAGNHPAGGDGDHAGQAE